MTVTYCPKCRNIDTIIAKGECGICKEIEERRNKMQKIADGFFWFVIKGTAYLYKRCNGILYSVEVSKLPAPDNFEAGELIPVQYPEPQVDQEEVEQLLKDMYEREGPRTGMAYEEWRKQLKGEEDTLN